ncbi:hypothetical protein O7Q_00159 [Bartonella quintana JK 39]|nr:hypothetical protein O7Q_00159 [Bartonella quintana JK 39]
MMVLDYKKELCALFVNRLKRSKMLESVFCKLLNKERSRLRCVLN